MSNQMQSGAAADELIIEQSLQSIDSKQTTANTLLGSIAGFVPSTYDNITVNYTDATKTVISSVIYKLGVTTVATITATYPGATQEIYTKT